MERFRLNPIVNTFKNEKGFTFFEALVALIFITAILLPLYRMEADQRLQVQYGKDRLLAGNLAQQLAEDLGQSYSISKITAFAADLQTNYNYTVTHEETKLYGVGTTGIVRVRLTITKGTIWLTDLEMLAYGLN